MNATSLFLTFAVAGTASAQPNSFRCSGTVVDATGRPVAGAVVELYQPKQRVSLPEPEMKPQQTVTTGADGRYTVVLSAGVNHLFAYKPGLAPTWIQHWNPMNDITDEQLVMTPPESVAGMVVDDADKPVAGAKVWVTSGYLQTPAVAGRGTLSYMSRMPKLELLSTVAGADGKFRIEGIPTNAAVDLAVSMPGKVLRSPEREYISPDTMRCRPGQKDVKLVLDPGGVVSGKIRSLESGKPIEGARIGLLPQGRVISGAQVEPVKSDAQGRFLLASVAPGSYRVQANFGSKPLADWVAETLPIIVEAGRTTKDLEISATRGGLLEVSVLAKETRKPLSPAMATAFKEDFNTWAEANTGGVAVLRLPGGDYQVSASAYVGNSHSEPVRTVVETDKTNRLEVELSAPPMTRGVVRDPSGAPVPGLSLLIFPPYGFNSGPVKTDRDGKFEFVWKPQQRTGMQETYSVIARDLKRGLALAQNLEDEAGQLELRLQPGLALSGVVQDAAGKPLSNAAVQLYLWSGNMGSPLDNQPAMTDARGQFEFRTLPRERKYSVSANANGYGSANQEFQAEETGTNRLELAPLVLRVADRQLSGEVIDSEEKPAAGAMVNIYGEGQPNASIRADEHGRFLFAQVCEGRIRISAYMGGISRAFGSASAQGGDTNVTIKLGVNQAYPRQEAIRRVSLKDKPLPELTGLGLPDDCAPEGKCVLLCLFDQEQRPSRRMLRLLAEQHDSLAQRGVAVLALQSAVTTLETFQEWKDGNAVPFPVGRIAEKNQKNRWASGIESLPWLILTDTNHQITAEGFPLEELENKLKR